ncbi:MAG: hypothetical protein N2253_03065 [Bacteroidia bacterium]|nr:hypothetical protein [Bacteroidia bacterium]
MYIKLWSLPPAEKIFEPEQNWTILDKFPIYRLRLNDNEASFHKKVELPFQGRAFDLLSYLLAEHEEEIRSYSPAAIYIGSARGEVGTLTEAIIAYERGEKPSPRLSPQTSAGSLASVVAQYLGVQGPALVISQTCLSGLAALHAASLFLKAGEGDTVLFGAVEAPLVPFFIETMAALRIYTQQKEYPFSRPGDTAQINSFALGEGAVLGVLSEKPISPFRLLNVKVRTAPPRSGMAFSAVDEEAVAHLLSEIRSKPDFVLLHAPGTRQGDTAEWHAVSQVWGDLPALSIKGLIGHSLGAAPLLGLAAALYLLQKQKWYFPPYPTLWPQRAPHRWKEAVVIGLGYGGVMGAIQIKYEP